MWGSSFHDLGNSFCSWGPSFGHGPGILGWVFPILFWGLIVYVIVSIIRQMFSRNQSNQGDSALDILRNRYASGEINEQEFKAQKTVLGKR